MAIQIPGFSFSIEASADLSSDQFKAVVVDSSGELALAGAAVAIVGVLQDKPDAQGKAGQVMGYGITKGILGATVASGARVAPNGSGLFITATGIGTVVSGICLDGGAVNELAEILLQPGGGDLNA